MKKYLISVLLLIIILATACSDKTQPGASPDAPFLLLVSIDGLTPEYIFAADKLNVEIPYLQSFINEGSFAEGVIGVIPTITYPSHTTLITGELPAQHGIYSNIKLMPTQTTNKIWYWYADEINGNTLWELAKRNNKITASIEWPTSVNADIDYNLPSYWHINPATDSQLWQPTPKPELLAELYPIVGNMLPLEGMEQDTQRIEIAKYLLQNKNIDFMTIHLGSFDTLSHSYGHLSNETKHAVEQLDLQLWQLQQVIEEIYGSNYVISIVSDHGFYPVSNDIYLNNIFHQAGLITTNINNQITDWQAYAWAHGGSSAIMLNNPDDAILVQQVRNLLETYANTPGSGVAQLLEAAEFNKQGYPNASFLVEAEIDYEFEEDITTTGNIQEKSSNPHSTHGRLPYREDMWAVFLIKGKNIPMARNLGVIEMIEIAPQLKNVIEKNNDNSNL